MCQRRWGCYMDFDGCSMGLRAGGDSPDQVRSAGSIAERLGSVGIRWSAGFGRAAAAAVVVGVVGAVGARCSRDAVVGGVWEEGPEGGGDDAAWKTMVSPSSAIALINASGKM